jgi:NDP-sugar pyrophosphorylase family protein
MTLIESVEVKPLGTAGAVKLALGHLDDTFFLLNGDTFVEVPLAQLLELHRSRGAAITLSLVRSDVVAEKGSVRIAPDGRVLDFAEKIEESSGLINAGVYVVEPRVFEACPPGVSCSVEQQIIPALLSAKDELVLGHIVKAPFVDIGLPEDYLRVRDQLPKSGGWAP